MNADTKHPVIAMMEEQKTWRTRAAPCAWAPTRASYRRQPWPKDVYGRKDITRAAPAPVRIQQYLPGGLPRKRVCWPRASTPQAKLVEIVEVKDHPWFVGVQFHPEYRSTVMKPHPLFVGFVQAAMKQGGSADSAGRGRQRSFRRGRADMFLPTCPMPR
jgi:CTP synthase